MFTLPPWLVSTDFGIIIIIIIIIIIMPLDYEIIGWIKELPTFENNVQIDSMEGHGKLILE